jgi:dolichol-phosphate mannosyltransferase
MRSSARSPIRRALVIIPTYNESENLPNLIPAILGQGDQFEVLVVDDNSPDGTGTIADAMAAENQRVHVLHRDGKQGLGTAYVAGFKYALNEGYDVVFEMDADFSHNPDDLPRLLAAVGDADVAIGSRWVSGGGTQNWALHRILISRGGSQYAKLVLGVPMNDLTSGFKCFRAEVLASINLDSVHSNGYAFQVEVNNLCYEMGFRVVEVPILFVDRRVGHSKMSKAIIFEAMGVCLRLRLSRSRRLAEREQATSPMPETPGSPARNPN